MDKFITGVNDTGDKFMTDTGDKSLDINISVNVRKNSKRMQPN